MAAWPPAHHSVPFDTSTIDSHPAACAAARVLLPVPAANPSWRGGSRPAARSGCAKLIAGAVL
eukprot:scaffold9334_cov122-Isochrysis_galbana.AAC.7